ncbi:tRNA-guanine transglycosylase DpdA [Tunturiibacter lichenicola]|uniref:tRNA-guanine transglycosylase DpdA n=1 Tax=Tunturiibacter lichenicola TaxID=2051959 RepID=UPI003D9BBD5C
MKFYFPDSQDQVDPSFDFDTEERSRLRLRHREDLYAHELFQRPPFDGVLVSKAVLDAGRYSIAQKHRMLRVGVREFFRISDPNLLTMGDCGAFTYVREERPPFSVEEVVEYYQTMGFDFGMSVDHIIFGYEPSDHDIPEDWRFRHELTLSLAKQFLDQHRKTKSRFTPIGVAQGWSPSSYADAVEQLQAMGYDYIALGGMIGLKTPDILSCLKMVHPILQSGVRMHILGITRIESVQLFADFGVSSIDSTSPLRQAFKDMKDNYYAPDRTYTALRVPQVEANPQLVRNIKAGKINQQEARKLEQHCLACLKQFDRGTCGLEETLDSLLTYETLYDDRRTFANEYRDTLQDEPWKKCPCDVCGALGIHVILFRGAERNRRRGFHNLHVFYNKLQQRKAAAKGLFDLEAHEALSR